MAKTLFDHIKQITDVQDPKYWDNLDEGERKTWNNYMILRFVSMKYEWTELVADIQPYVQELPPRALYLTLIDLLPKSRTFLKYMKPVKGVEYEKWLIELIGKYYEVSLLEAEDYIHILYSIKEGHSVINEICTAYGIEPKEIKKLKLKL